MLRARIVNLTTVVLVASSTAHAAPSAIEARPPTLQERLLLREQWVRYKEHERLIVL